MPAGRPRKELDAEQVYKLAKLGCTLEEIADVFNVSVSTISTNYREVCQRARGEMKTSLRRSQYLRAVRDKSDKMLIHLGMQYLGQAEKSEQKTQVQPPVILPDNGRDNPPEGPPVGIPEE